MKERNVWKCRHDLVGQSTFEGQDRKTMPLILKVMFNLHNGSFMLKHYKAPRFKLVSENEGSSPDASSLVHSLTSLRLPNCYRWRQHNSRGAFGIYFFLEIFSICFPIAFCTFSSSIQSQKSLMSSALLFSSASTNSFRSVFLVNSLALPKNGEKHTTTSPPVQCASVHHRANI